LTRSFITLAVLGLLAWILLLIGSEGLTAKGVETSFMLGFVLLSSYLAGTLCDRVRLPRITGYILSGIVFGPYLIDFISVGVLKDLDVFINMAFAFIGLAAGAELRLDILRERAKSVILLILFTSLMVIVGVTAVMLASHPLVPFMANRPMLQVLAMCSLIGVVAIARSPSSTIAIINETRSKGPFTESVLGVAMSVDLLILPLFSITVALSALAMSPEGRFDATFIFMLTGEIAAFAVVGVLIGLLVAAYIRFQGPQISIVILGLCFLVYRSSFELEHYLREVHDITLRIEPLLICAAAGFTVQNISRQGHRLIHAMSRVDLPVYVVFFTMAGAGLNIDALVSSWLIAIVLVTARLLTMLFGSRLATRFAGDPPVFRKYIWMGFLTQAGLSIALATQLKSTFGDWGEKLGTLLIAAIAVNQILGPAAFKYALGMAGETRQVRLEFKKTEAAKETS
jgi:Kef-type K+ transport system membrane component KefB